MNLTKSLFLLITPLFLSLSTLAQAKATIDVNQKESILARKAPSINKVALKTALQAYQCAAQKGYIKKPLLTVIDYSKPSTKPRLWTFNLKNNHLLFHSLVAHGKNSGKLKANRFSNVINSKQSSLGLFVTGHKYIGTKGHAMRLRGLDKGFNTHAMSRAVVMHGAYYVSKQFARVRGRLGLSWGCPAVPLKLAKPLINKIKDGSALFTYYPSKSYLKHSKFLHC